MNKILNSKGFTLIELLVVIAIIGVLASIVVVTLSGSTTSAKDAATVANLRSIPSVITSKIDPDNPSSFSGAGACDFAEVKNVFKNIFANNIESKSGSARDLELDPITGHKGVATGKEIYGVSEDNDGGKIALGATTANSTTPFGCVSDSDGWAIWGRIGEGSDDDGYKYYCIDSKGSSGKRELEKADVTGVASALSSNCTT